MHRLLRWGGTSGNGKLLCEGVALRICNLAFLMLLRVAKDACHRVICHIQSIAGNVEEGERGRGRGRGNMVIPGPPGAKPEYGGLEAVHAASPGSVARNVDQLGVDDQLQQHRQQLEPGSRPACTASTSSAGLATPLQLPICTMQVFVSEAA